MFMQGVPPPPPPLRESPPALALDAAQEERLRLLLSCVDTRVRVQRIVWNAVCVASSTVSSSAIIIREAIREILYHFGRLIDAAAKVPDAAPGPSRLLTFLGAGGDRVSETKFAELEAELNMLKSQMAMLVQSGVVPGPPPPPPAAPPAPPVGAPPPVKLRPHPVPVSNDLLCSDVSDDDPDESPLPSYRERQERPVPPAAPTRGFAAQIQQANRTGLRKTEISRSPGGTPLNRKPAPAASDNFHKEILANALFKKFQNARQGESPERRPRREPASSFAPRRGSGLAFISDEVADDEWDDDGDAEGAR
ncbi:WH2 domain-containing protein [Plasmodiophora brassicae]|uniref:Uncharacterized protein n=1 Tax=Plasmodiophora brassicae TaxID=37360 RepID=A0A3P3YQ38_PLABS|nr:unnamed protein product [Plasmodiophora brassicae]